MTGHTIRERSFYPFFLSFSAWKFDFRRSPSISFYRNFSAGSFFDPHLSILFFFFSFFFFCNCLVPLTTGSFETLTLVARGSNPRFTPGAATRTSITFDSLTSDTNLLFATISSMYFDLELANVSTRSRNSVLSERARSSSSAPRDRSPEQKLAQSNWFALAEQKRPLAAPPANDRNVNTWPIRFLIQPFAPYAPKPLLGETDEYIVRYVERGRQKRVCQKEKLHQKLISQFDVDHALTILIIFSSSLSTERYIINFFFRLFPRILD